MGFVVQASPGIKTREIDLTTAVVMASGTTGAFAGRFTWGPVLQPVLVSAETDLEQRFGKPKQLKESVDFLTASSFLAYTSGLRVVRIGDEDVMLNAGDSTPVFVPNDDAYDSFSSTANSFIAKFPGELGNSLSVHVALDEDQFSLLIEEDFTFTKGSKEVSVDADAVTLSDYFTVGDQIQVEGAKYSIVAVTDGVQSDQGAVPPVDMVPGKLHLSRAFVGASGDYEPRRVWKYAYLFGQAPAADKAHIVVVDTAGDFTNVPGTVLEVYQSVDVSDPNAKNEDGTAAYYAIAINRGSQYIRHGGADITSTAAGDNAHVFGLSGGVSGNEQAGTGELIDGYNLFQNAEKIDIALPFVGAADQTVANFVIDNIADVRRDVVVFVGPEMDDVVNNKGNEVQDVTDFRNSLTSSSYAFYTDNWKYMYDKYNDVYRWVPVTGDIAGMVARTEIDRAAWFSPAGYNRGIMKNVVKLAWSAEETQRNDLYPIGINSVVDIDGAGKVLMGDKTLAANQTSAFSRINVRRLFIVLAKSIANAAKYSLFEFNDEFTRAAFVAMVEPFLREIQGGRGLIDFEVVCDERNNTPYVIDTNNFVGDIYVKPNRSINFITLNFVAVGTGVSFDEVIGRAA